MLYAWCGADYYAAVDTESCFGFAAKPHRKSRWSRKNEGTTEVGLDDKKVAMRAE